MKTDRQQNLSAFHWLEIWDALPPLWQEYMLDAYEGGVRFLEINSIAGVRQVTVVFCPPVIADALLKAMEVLNDEARRQEPS